MSQSLKVSESIYGISSNIPFITDMHYLLVDVDENLYAQVHRTALFMESHGIQVDWIERTPHGYHVYCFKQFKFETLVELLSRVPHVDKNWVQIGIDRGYWFLWTHSKLPLDLFYRGIPINFMRLSFGGDNDWLERKRRL